MKSIATAARRSATTKVGQRQLSMELLLDAALRLFVSQGYRSTNLEQISSAAGLTKGAVYFYFRSKETVLLELLKRVQAVVVDRALEVANVPGESATARMVAYVHYQAGLGITHRDEVLLLILMALEFKERDGEVQSFIANLYGRQCEFIEAIVSSGQERGEFRSDVPTRELASLVLAINDGTFLEWYRRSSTLDGGKLVRALRAMVLGGLGATGQLAVPSGTAPAPRSPAARKAKAPRKG